MYLILEALNISRVANSMGSVGVAQRALAEALSFAQRRSVFGKPLIEQPLMRKQFEDRFRALEESLALAWEMLGCRAKPFAGNLTHFPGEPPHFISRLG